MQKNVEQMDSYQHFYAHKTLGARVLLEDTREVRIKIRSMVVNFNNAIHILRLRLNF